MFAFAVALSFYSDLAVAVLVVHTVFILWVIFGAFLVGRRPILRWLHIASLVWAICTEALYWPCPLTMLENWLEQQAGVQPYQGGFLLHYMDKLVYPDVPANLLTIVAVVICAANLAFYARLFWRRSSKIGVAR